MRQLLDASNELIDTLEKLDLQEGDWSQFPTDDTRLVLDTSEWIAKQICAQGGNAMPNSQSVVQHLQRLKNYVNQIQQFSLERGHSKNERTNIQSNLESSLQSLLAEAGPWASTMALRLAENPASDAHRQLDKIKQLHQHAQQNGREIETALDAARQAAAEAGAAVFTEDFSKEAARLSKAATLWLVPAVLLAGAALAETVRIVFFADAPTAGWEWAFEMGGRVFGLSLLVFAASWCGRVSLANLHSAAVNRHRAASLRTLQAFRQSAADSSTKDAVVLEAARAVYENVPTGYLGKSSSDGHPTGRTLELLHPLGLAGKGTD